MSGRRSSSVGRQRDGNLGKHGHQRLGDDGQFRRRLADEYGNRVLELRARERGFDDLRLRRLELCFGLRDVAARDDARGILVARELQRSLVVGDRLPQQRNLRILDAQQQVILREQRLRGEPGAGQVRVARLRTGAAGLDAAANPAPEIELPAGVEPTL